MLARDKLEESRFFLHRLEESQSDAKSFRFYLSAFLSAARSVTFVLQADLRSEHGAAFDEWYDEQCAKLAADPLARRILEARNTFLKEGNRVRSLRTFRTSDPDGAKVSMEYVLDRAPLTADSIKKVSIHFPSGRHTFTGDDEAVERWVRDHFLDLLEEAKTIMATSAVSEVEIALLAEDAFQASDELLRELHSYIDMVAAMIEEAGTRFPPA